MFLGSSTRRSNAFVFPCNQASTVCPGLGPFGFSRVTVNDAAGVQLGFFFKREQGCWVGIAGARSEPLKGEPRSGWLLGSVLVLGLCADRQSTATGANRLRLPFREPARVLPPPAPHLASGNQIREAQ